MTHRERELFTYALAWQFTNHTKEITELATEFNVSIQTIRNWAKTKAFREATKAFGHKGKINFGNTHARRGDPDVETARREYRKAIAEGQPKKAVSRAARSVGKHINVIRDWRDRFQWDRKG